MSRWKCGIDEHSRHDESPLVNQKAKPLNDQLGWEGLLAVHKIADQNEEHDKNVKVHRRRKEEVVCEEQKGLGSVSALDGSDDPIRLDRSGAVGRGPEGNNL